MNRLYTLLFYLALPFIVARLWWRGRKLPAYRQRIKERFGFYNTPKHAQTLWVHAVSYGEMVAADNLVNHLLEHYSDQHIVITNMTTTGAERAQQRFASKMPDRVTQVYLPYDFPGAIKRFLRHFQPRFGLIMETELWPNLLRYCHRRQMPILLANARLSTRSTRGYARIKSLTGPMMHAIQHIGAQTRTDARRFKLLGAKNAQLSVVGNVKFDAEPNVEQITRAKTTRQNWTRPQRPVFIAASTHEGEEAQVLEAFAKIKTHQPETLLILVPRHPDRFADVLGLCQTKPYQVARHSQQEQPTSDTDILLGDTMGELFYFYGLSDVAFVGGSLTPIGGHNLIEPISAEVPVITGPHLFHQAEIQQRFPQGRCRLVVSDADALAKAVLTLFHNESQRTELITTARKIWLESQGALARHCALIDAMAT